MQKITTFLWFNNQAEEAANFYVLVFNNNPNKKIVSKLDNASHYDDASSEASGQPKDTVMVAAFELEGQEFSAINGGPAFKFTEAISLMVSCRDQKEIDYFWNSLTANGGQESQCGWLKDKYGLSWQIVPDGLGKIMGGNDEAGSEHAMAALMKMKKINIADLEKAYDNK